MTDQQKPQCLLSKIRETEFHPAPFGDFSAELQDPWPVVERLRMALREAERYCLGAENTTGHCITSLLEILPDEDD